jgi:peptidoglycan hydrolase-like protein with peptidoglycan-binding domain
MYRVDNEPVVLLYGGLPPYRSLRPGLAGPDVRQVEENLAALGYSGFTVDARYTAATAAAVRRWQAGGGLPPTGQVEPGRVVVASGSIRVSDWHLAPGDSAAGRILSYTGTTRVVTVDLAVGLQTLVQPGLATIITLPDGRTTPGTVASVGAVATIRRAVADDPTREADDTATIAVTVAVADQAALGTLHSAPVEVALVSARTEHALEVVGGGTTRYVAVQTGMFADGRVEISGPGIAEGTVVGVPE